MFKRMPIPFLYVLGTGILLGTVIGFKSLIPYLYFGDLAEYEWEKSALPHIINYLFWPFLVPLIHWTFERYRMIKVAPLSDKVKTVLMSLLVPFIHETATTAIYFFFLNAAGMHEFNEKSFSYVKAAFPSVYIGRIVEFWIIYGLFAAFDFYKKYKDKQAELVRIEAQLNRTKLAVLKMQLQPHFLFNALNSISSLMDIDVKKAQTVTAKLGDLLRGILEQDNRVFITLEEELHYVKTYLDIEKIRFEDRLNIVYDIYENTLNHQLPILLIQPLVENAIKYGVAPTSKNVEIEVTAQVLNGLLKITVKDNGKGQELLASEMLKKGVGLRNIKERLDQFYPNKYQLHIETKLNEGFRIEISLPTKFHLNEND
jgi:two-component system, LytTR family, sensor kinase